MTALVIILFAAITFQEACGSVEYDYGHSGDLRYHGPTAIPHVLKDGHIADTHEVAAAKGEHFNAVVKAKILSGYGYGGSYGGYVYDTPYYGPLAKPVVLKSGYLADTHEVVAAKIAHHNAVATAKAHSGYGSDTYGYGGESYGYESGHYNTPYHGPTAEPVVLKSGYLADTYEVAAAKERHLNALHAANSYKW